MALVQYSDSEDDDNAKDVDSRSIKKRQTTPPREDGPATKKPSLPPLPTTFRDLYSSTVRTSTQDDPSLHGGRKRIKPHVQGNWPTHVYLEWHPSPKETTTLRSLLTRISSESPGTEIHSLLTNSLSVSLPLHISLSRPLTLKTEQKDIFLSEIQRAISHSQARSFGCKVKKLSWHPNEFKTRWFLVLVVEEVEDGGELTTLLKACNGAASAIGLEVLYDGDSDGQAVQSKFHVSLAWSLTQQKAEGELAADLEALESIHFEEVKVRIGQEVSVVKLPEKRLRRQESA